MPTTPAVSTKSGGKGRPTPKRRDAQARGLHPVVPADRKAAKREQRAREDAAWQRQQQAMLTGDERYLPARDKGPVRRYIRDYVDARWSLGELFLPASLLMMLVIVGMSIHSTPTTAVVALWVLMVVYGLLGLAVRSGASGWADRCGWCGMTCWPMRPPPTWSAGGAGDAPSTARHWTGHNDVLHPWCQRYTCARPTR